jgi:D-proline reductase (dithiol) PrdB
MCNQTVGLVGAELERNGIATVCISLLRHVSERVRPPRTLLVPFPHGYPLGRPGDPELQSSILRAALSMLTDAEVEAGTIRAYPPL